VLLIITLLNELGASEIFRKGICGQP